MRASEFLPLGARMAKTLKGAMDHYASLSTVPPSMRRPAVVLWVNLQLEAWNPMVRGITVLDPLSRTAAAEFIGGVAFNVADELTKRRGAA
jgi:hypothetical protein